MKVRIVVANPKGGVTKSTTVIHLTAALREIGLRVLVADLDSQANVTDYYYARHGGAVAAITGQETLADALEGGDILSASPALSELWMHLPKQPAMLGRLARLLDQARSHDVAILDTPGYIGVELACALACATLVLVPVVASEWSLEAVGPLFQELETHAPKAPVALLPNAFGKARDDRELLASIRELEYEILPPIPWDKNLKIRTEKRMPAASNSKAFQAYREVAAAIVSHAKLAVPQVVV